MELLPDGKMVLDEQDTVGVLALIYAKTRMVVDIHATTDSSLSTCHADPPRTRARAYAESNPLKSRFNAIWECVVPSILDTLRRQPSTARWPDETPVV